MKTTTMTLLMICSVLVACDPPSIDPQERCTVSFEFNKCRCHLYDLMKQKRIGDAYDKEITYCDDVTGFHANDWLTEVTPWAKELRRWGNDECR